MTKGGGLFDKSVEYFVTDENKNKVKYEDVKDSLYKIGSFWKVVKTQKSMFYAESHTCLPVTVYVSDSKQQPLDSRLSLCTIYFVDHDKDSELLLKGINIQPGGVDKKTCSVVANDTAYKCDRLTKCRSTKYTCNSSTKWMTFYIKNSKKLLLLGTAESVSPKMLNYLAGYFCDTSVEGNHFLKGSVVKTARPPKPPKSLPPPVGLKPPKSLPPPVGLKPPATDNEGDDEGSEDEVPMAEVPMDEVPIASDESIVSGDEERVSDDGVVHRVSDYGESDYGEEERVSVQSPRFSFGTPKPTNPKRYFAMPRKSNRTDSEKTKKVIIRNKEPNKLTINAPGVKKYWECECIPEHVGNKEKICDCTVKEKKFGVSGGKKKTLKRKLKRRKTVNRKKD